MPSETQVIPAPARPLTILVADDEPMNRKLLRAQLEAAGDRVIDCADGVEALAILARTPVDVIVSDIFMPRMDGFRLCDEVRQRVRLSAVPFIFFSATCVSANDEKLGRELGADDFLRKPAGGAEIAAAIRKATAPSHQPTPRRRRTDTSLAEPYAERLISKLEEKNAELRRAMQALDAAYDGIFQFDPVTLRFIQVNQGAVAQTGYSREELLSMTALDLKPEYDEPRYRRMLEPLVAGTTATQTLTTVHRRKDGTRLPVEVIIQWITRAPGDHAMVAVARDITERTRAEAEVRQFRAAMDETVDGIFIIDPATSRILDCNAAAQAAGGYTRQELLAMGITDLDTESTGLAHWQSYVEQIKAGPLTVETGSRRKDGSAFPVEVKVRYVEAQPQAYLVAVVRDITERKAAEARILKLNADLEQRVRDRTAQLEAANKDLEGFSYSISHDLRAPLRAIDNFSAFLLEDHAAQLDAEGQRLLGVIRQNTARMGKLINDVLDFSRAGRAEIASRPIDMKALAAEVWAAVQPAQPRPVRFTVGDLPPAQGDVRMIRQVLANLLGNALKFTGKREDAAVTVTGTVEGGECVYSVRDNGAGFDARYAQKLFGVFQRLHSTEQFEGTGIGLAIVKRLVTRHAGRVGAQGEVGAGATFWFSLPRRPQGEGAGP